MFKLSGDSHAAAMAIAGAAMFDPSGMDRPMKAWVVVPPDQADRWRNLATQALADLLADPAPSHSDPGAGVPSPAS